MENLLNRNIEKEYGMQSGATIAGTVVGLVVGIVLVVGAAIPITNSIITSSGLTGTNQTILLITVTLLCLTPAILVSQLF